VVFTVNLAGQKAVLSSVLSMLRSCFQTRTSMQIEILALRYQLVVLQRRTKKRPNLRIADRFLWVMLSRAWGQWRSALVIVKPETVIALAAKRVSLVLGLEE
jgi:putative transposase